MPLRGRTRQAWLRVHRWLGLGLGGVHALLGLTGSVLVFYLDIDEWLHAPATPAQVRVRTEAPPALSADAVLARLRTLHPQRTGPWRIERPLHPQDPIRARYYAPVERAGRLFAPLVVTLDAATLERQRESFWGDDPVTWVYDLHYALLLDRTGHTIVGLAGLVMLASLFGGIVLWWPSRRRWRESLRPLPRPGIVRRIHDLHVLAGVYSIVVLMMLALTGAAMALPAQTRWLLEQAGIAPSAPTRIDVTRARPALSTPDERRRAADGDTAVHRASSSIDAAIAVAAHHFPDAEVRWIETSGADAEPIMLRIHQRDEPSRRFPQTRLWFDADDGRLIAVRDPRQGTAGDTVLGWLHPLHNGEVFGLAGRWLVLVCGLVPVLLLATGTWRWRQRTDAARRAAHRTTRGSPPVIAQALDRAQRGGVPEK